MIKLFFKSFYKRPKLLYYWHVQDGQIKELINSGNFKGKNNFFYTENRFGNNNSAFRLQRGYFELEPITRLGLDLTILAWVKLYSYINFQRLFDFGNGLKSDNLLVSLPGSTTPLYFCLYNGNKEYCHHTDIIFPLLNWNHLGLVIKGGSAYLYLNGSLVGSTNLGIPNVIRKINRTICFIGKSSWDNIYSDGSFDTIKFFNGALKEEHVKDEYLADFD